MANVRIQDLPAGGLPANTSLFEMENPVGSGVKQTGAQLLTYIQTTIPTVNGSQPGFVPPAPGGQLVFLRSDGWQTIPTFGLGAGGIVPGPPAVGVGTFLRDDGTWQAAGGGGGLINAVTTTSGGAAGQLMYDDGAHLQESSTIKLSGGNLNIVTGTGGLTNGILFDGNKGLFFSNSSGNLFFGRNAASSTTGGTYNVSIGYLAGQALNGANYNVLIGGNAGVAITSGTTNVYVGHSAGSGGTTPSNDVAIGANSLINASYTSAGGNVAIGANTMGACTTGINNVCIGVGAGNLLTSGNNNVVISVGGGLGITSNSGAVILGSGGSGGNAGGKTFGTETTVVGFNTATGNIGQQAVAIGGRALSTDSGPNNTAVGWAAGADTTAAASGNTFIGHQAGRAIISGTGNIVIGDSVGLGLAAGLSNNVILVDGNNAVAFQWDGVNKITTAASVVQLVPIAIASLPAAGVKGRRAIINNGIASPAFGAVVSATGAATWPVFDNGTAWAYG